MLCYTLQAKQSKKKANKKIHIASSYAFLANNVFCIKKNSKQNKTKQNTLNKFIFIATKLLFVVVETLFLSGF